MIARKNRDVKAQLAILVGDNHLSRTPNDAHRDLNTIYGEPFAENHSKTADAR